MLALPVGLMSFTIVVPAAVPSLRQSSAPLVPSLATNISTPSKLATTVGDEEEADGQMSCTRNVPAAVPSDRHSSWPFVELSSAKYATLFTTAVDAPKLPPRPVL